MGLFNWILDRADGLLVDGFLQGKYRKGEITNKEYIELKIKLRDRLKDW